VLHGIDKDPPFAGKKAYRILLPLQSVLFSGAAVPTTDTPAKRQLSEIYSCTTTTTYDYRLSVDITLLGAPTHILF
jgi:hypothetical protein